MSRPSSRGGGGTPRARGRSRGVPAVVDDALRVGVREAHARERRVLERRSPSPSRGRARADPHERSTSITSSRLRSMSSSERASRFRRSSGSVFDGRTFRCQSSASIEMPSRCETRPSRPNRSLDLLDLHRDVCDRHVQLAREEVRLAERAEELGEECPLRDQLEHERTGRRNRPGRSRGSSSGPRPRRRRRHPLRACGA